MGDTSISADLKQKLAKVSTATLTMQLIKKGVRTTWIKGAMPMFPERERMVGPAFTLRFIPGREDLSTPENYAKPGSMREGLEACPAGHVLVIDGRGSEMAATLGDILVHRLKVKGVTGVVADTPMRDVAEIRKAGLQMFHCGNAAPPSITGLAFADWQTAIGCGGVAVIPGDIIVGDEDGCVVIPRHLAEEVAEGGLQQERFEAWVQKKVREGRSVVGLYPPNAETVAEYEKDKEENKA